MLLPHLPPPLPLLKPPQLLPLNKPLPKLLHNKQVKLGLCKVVLVLVPLLAFRVLVLL
jgi:hypothetical protein